MEDAARKDESDAVGAAPGRHHDRPTARPVVDNWVEAPEPSAPLLHGACGSAGDVLHPIPQGALALLLAAQAR